MKRSKLLVSGPTDTAIMRFAKLGLLTSVAAFGLLVAATGSVSAYVITVQISPSVNPFTLLPLGTSITPNSYVNSNPFTLDGESITYTQGNMPNPGTTGEYDGNFPGVMVSPFGSSNSNSNFLDAAAQGGSCGCSTVPIPGTVTITYATPQTALDLLWGSVDYFNQNALLTVGGGLNITGLDIFNAANAEGYGLNINNQGAYNMWVEITGLPSFTVADAEDQSTSNGFEFVPGIPVSAQAVPEPSSLALLGMGLLGFGWLGRRRLKRA